jgi:hypothetical protein
MSKITLEKLWPKLSKDDIGTERARINRGDDKGVIIGPHYGVGFDVQWFAENPSSNWRYERLMGDTEVEWPIQEKKEQPELEEALETFKELMRADIKSALEMVESRLNNKLAEGVKNTLYIFKDEE